MIPEGAPPAGLETAQYAAIADFRRAMRRFLAFSETAAATEGLPPQQHQGLLAIAGRPASDPATVGFVADQLLIAPHTAAELTTRMADADLVVKTPSPRDRRRVELTLTPRARALLVRLTAAHLEELRTLEPALVSALREASGGGS